MTTNEFIAQKPSEADVGSYSWEVDVVKDLESENAAKGQPHNMFSRIFRVRIYEFFTNISQLEKKTNFLLVKKVLLSVLRKSKQMLQNIW